MPAIRCMNLIFTIDENAGKACFSGKGYQQAPGASFWRMLLDDGFYLEMPALSLEQTGRASMNGDEMVIAYDHIEARGKSLDISLAIRVQRAGNLLSFTAQITNHEKSIRVNEFACPFMQVSELNGSRENDRLYLPDGLGLRVPDPWNNLRTWHSQYMDGDETEVVRSMYYPEASMAWMAVESGDQVLYIGRHDPQIHGTVMQAGCSPYGKDPRLSLRFVHLPMALEGETVSIPPVCVGLLPGDWMTASRIYRAWADQAFFTPTKPQQWIRSMNGWQRLILRSQYGDDYYLPEDLPALYEEGARHGINSLFLFGWWDTGMDNGYPEYPISESRAKALKENIAKVRAMGGHVILVCNANFIDADTEYGRKYGQSRTQLDRRGHARFRKCCYSPVSATRSMKMFSDSPFFLYPCSGSAQWRKTLISQCDMLKAYEPDCIFYDCYGIEPNGFCFNPDHEHGNRVDQEWLYKRGVLQAVKDSCGQDYVFATEQVTDIAAAYTQFIHGCRGSFEPDSPYLFPHMFRQTFPEVITTNRGARDSRPGFERNLRFSFVMGLRYDVEIYRCRRGVESEPPYAEEVSSLNALRQKYADYMIEGQFDVSGMPSLPDQVYGAQYLSADRRRKLTVLWNGAAQAVNVLGKVIPANGIDFSEEPV